MGSAVVKLEHCGAGDLDSPGTAQEMLLTLRNGSATDVGSQSSPCWRVSRGCWGWGTAQGVDPRPGEQEQPLPGAADAWRGLEALGEAAWGTEHGAN